MDNEWGPWIDHDGESIPPLYGKYIHAVFSNGFEAFGIFDELQYIKLPAGLDDPDAYVTRYRLRKPRGPSILQEIAANHQRELERTE